MKKEEPSKIKSDILLRVRLLYALFILAGAVIFVRLIWVQFFCSETDINAERLAKRIFVEQPVLAHRGTILARNGTPLATSIFRYQVAFDFGASGLDSLKTFYEQSDSLAKLLSAFFKDKPAAEYRKLFRSERARRYRLVNPRDTLYLRSEGWLSRRIDRMRGEEWIKQTLYDTIRDHRPVNIFPREVDMAEWEILRRYPLLNYNMGLVYQLIERDERIYPQGELARRTVGRTGDRGNYGIEDAYREELAGKDGKALRQRIARGFYGRVAGEQEEPIDGLDVVTTIDPNLQEIADKTLRRQLEAQNAIWGTTIVMEVETGEILAIANLGRSGTSGAFSEEENYAIGRSMEPGSTFKLATMLALLDDAQISPATKYQVHNGEKVTVGSVVVQDTHRGDFIIDLNRAIANSSNVYFCKAVWDNYGINGKIEQYGDFLRNKLHLEQKVMPEQLGEASPIIATAWDNYKPNQQTILVKMAYGYRVQLTPIQMITFYNAIANGGKKISPLLVREIKRGDKTVKRFESKVLAPSICSGAALKEVRRGLEETCITGTAAAYFKDTTYLRVAAKTGTAQVTDRAGMAERDYLGTVVAYFPADNPRYTVLTSIRTRYQPGKAYYGGPLAGPVVKRMVEYIHNRDNFEQIKKAEGKQHYPKEIKGGNIAYIRTVADKFSPRTSFDRRSGWGEVRVDTLSNVSIATLPVESGTMPNVLGMGLKDALFLLENHNLQVRFTGKGTVTKQSIAAGEAIKEGETVSITLN